MRRQRKVDETQIKRGRGEVGPKGRVKEVKARKVFVQQERRSKSQSLHQGTGNAAMNLTYATRAKCFRQPVRQGEHGGRERKEKTQPIFLSIYGYLPITVTESNRFYLQSIIFY